MFDDLPGNIWIDGNVMPWRNARIHVMTHGLHYSSSVFEGIRSYNGKLFKAKEHYERLHKSAEYLGFNIHYDVDELINATLYLMQDGGYNNAYVRAITWCGTNKMLISTEGLDVHTAIGIWEKFTQFPESFYTQGIRMNISDWRRPHPKTAPVHSKAACLYAISSISKKSSQSLGFDDALMLDYEGYIAEATVSNIFLVIDGKLYTPIPDCFLNGITRLTCIDIANSCGIDVIESKIKLEDLSKAQEVFLTGTAVEILPVGSIEAPGGKMWKFTPGIITHTIRDKFKEMTNK